MNSIYPLSTSVQFFCLIFDQCKKETFDIVTFHVKVIYGKLINMQLF